MKHAESPLKVTFEDLVLIFITKKSNLNYENPVGSYYILFIL